MVREYLTAALEERIRDANTLIPSLPHPLGQQLVTDARGLQDVLDRRLHPRPFQDAIRMTAATCGIAGRSSRFRRGLSFEFSGDELALTKSELFFPARCGLLRR